MKKQVLAWAIAGLLVVPAYGAAREAPLPVRLAVTVGGIKDGQPIPDAFAYCKPDGAGGVTDGGNINPSVRWLETVPEAKSYVLLVVDKDVPASFELANRQDATIPAAFPRQDFYHWVLVDIPPGIRHIGRGKDSSKVIEGGKPVGKVAYGVNGQNDYASFMAGSYGGYDGPCPPWNDERIHHYHFQVYALDVASLGLTPPFTGKDVVAAMQGHIVGMGETVGTYSNRPSPVGKR